MSEQSITVARSAVFAARRQWRWWSARLRSHRRGQVRPGRAGHPAAHAREYARLGPGQPDRHGRAAKEVLRGRPLQSLHSDHARVRGRALQESHTHSTLAHIQNSRKVLQSSQRPIQVSLLIFFVVVYLQAFFLKIISIFYLKRWPAFVDFLERTTAVRMSNKKQLNYVMREGEKVINLF
jgi:hypothetical protein